MIAAIRRLFSWERREPVDTNASQGDHAREDAYDPRPAQEALLKRIRDEAEADALRHAEDMARRQLPIVEEAESVGAQRIAALGAAYAAARSRLDAQVAAGRARVRAAEAQLENTEEALEEAGVPADRVGLAPLGAGLVSRWQVALGLGIGALVAVGVARFDLEFGTSLLICAAGLLLVLALLALRIGQPESAAVASLRHNRRREAEELERHRESVESDLALTRGLIEETLRLAEAETAFAKEMVAAYESAATSALPVGALGDGERAIRKQREPDVGRPPWLEELEGEDL